MGWEGGGDLQDAVNAIVDVCGGDGIPTPPPALQCPLIGYIGQLSTCTAEVQSAKLELCWLGVSVDIVLASCAFEAVKAPEKNIWRGVGFEGYLKAPASRGQSAGGPHREQAASS